MQLAVLDTAYTYNVESFMARRVSAREARARFAELTDRVRYAGESVIIEKQGEPFVAVVSLEDFALIERLRPLETIRNRTWEDVADQSLVE